MGDCRAMTDRNWRVGIAPALLIKHSLARDTPSLNKSGRAVSRSRTCMTYSGSITGSKLETRSKRNLISREVQSKTVWTRKQRILCNRRSISAHLCTFYSQKESSTAGFNPRLGHAGPMFYDLQTSVVPIYRH